jgi:arsenate reductase (glutaredoxin)
MKARIYHNPRCSKSRAALALLEARGVDVEIVEYLRHPPPSATLKQLVAKLGADAHELVRTSEPEYRAFVAAHGEPSGDALLELLAEEPRLLQRPIVEVGARARIGRPPERILELFT